MNFIERIALHHWIPRIVALLVVLVIVGKGLLDVYVIKAIAEANKELGFQECQQAQVPVPGLRLEAPSAQLPTDENGSVPWPFPLPGDLNGDCKVNIVDIMLVAKEWGKECQY